MSMNSQGGPGLRQPAQTGPRSEDVAGAGRSVCQADGSVDQHGGELQPSFKGTQPFDVII